MVVMAAIWLASGQGSGSEYMFPELENNPLAYR